MNYCKKLGQGLILAKKHSNNFTTPCSIPPLSVLHQSKDLHNFHKGGQHLTVNSAIGRIKGLDEGLLLVLSLVIILVILVSKSLKKKLMVPFYGWGSTTSRLEPLRGGSLVFTTKFPKIPGTHFIDLKRMKD